MAKARSIRGRGSTYRGVRRIRGSFAAAALAIQIAACGSYVRVPFEVSGPATLPPDISGEVRSDGLTTLNLTDLNIRFEARNQRGKGVAVGISPLMVFPIPTPGPASEATSDTHDLPFLLFLDLEPRVQGFTFDPMSVRVTPVGSVSLSPVAYVGPGRTDGARCVDPSSGKDRLSRSVQSSAFPLTPAEDPTCFAILFGRQVFPTTRFQLDLGGLTRGGTPVEVPTIALEKRNATAITGPRTWRPASLKP